MEAFLVLARHEQSTHLHLAHSALPNAPVQPDVPSRSLVRRAAAWVRSAAHRRRAPTPTPTVTCPATPPSGVRYSA